jgi:hypothetical protein
MTTGEPLMKTLMFVFCALVATHAAATNFLVTSNASSGAGSLEQAITDANADPAEPHTITIASNLEIIGSLPTITRSLTISAPTPTVKIRGFNNRLFQLRGENGRFVINNLILSNGQFGSASADRGGCINAVFSTFSIQVSNTIFDGCSLDSNQPIVQGGAIYANADVTVIDSVIRGSRIATSASGIFNTSLQGSAIHQAGGTLTLIRSKIHSNSISDSARSANGGIYLASGANLRASQSAFYNNNIFFGGDAAAIYVANGTADIDSSSFYNNFARSGAAIELRGTLRLQNSSFYNNTSNQTPTTGVVVVQGDLAMRNNAFLGNSAHLYHLSGSVFGFSGNVFGAQREIGCQFQTMPAAARANFGTPSCAAVAFDLRAASFDGFGLASPSDVTPTFGFAPNSPIFDAYANGASSQSDYNLCAPADSRGMARPTDDDSDGLAECDAGPNEGRVVVAVFKDGFE